MPTCPPRRLPGLRFVAKAQPLDDGLPRMDVAAFVGFAATGPLHTPVAVEDAAQFAAIFGDDAPLAWDKQRGERVYAYLAPAVRAFFRNGGRRCWVVRVAGAHAHTNRFAVPGLMALDGDHLLPAYALARSPGSWSDSLQVGASLLSRPVVAHSISNDGAQLDLSFASAETLAPGDLLRLTFGTTGYILLFAINRLEIVDAGSPPAGQPRERLLRAEARVLRWFVAAPSSPVSPLGSPPDAEARLLPLDPPPAVLPAEPPFAEQLSFELWVRQGGATPLRLSDLGFAPGHPRFWGALPGDVAILGEPPLPAYTGLWRAAAALRFPLAGDGLDVVYLPVALTGVPEEFAGPEPAEGSALDRDGLNLFGAHLFLDPDMVDARLETLMAQADFLRYQSLTPRPLRGIHAALAIDEASIIAVPDALHTGWQLTPPEVAASPEASDPLSRPEWWHFLDCDAPAPTTPLAEPERSAVHGAEGLPMPTLERVDQPRRPVVVLAWSSAAEGATYILEQARSPDYADATEVYRAPERQVRLYGRVPGDYFYRVRAEAGSLASDWSNGVAVRVPAGTIPLAPRPRRDQFLDCDVRVVPPPTWETAAAPSALGSYTLRWNSPEDDARYVVEEATDPTWSDAATIYSGPRTSVEIYGRSHGTYYYRARVEAIGRSVFQVTPDPPLAICGEPAPTAQATILRWPGVGHADEQYIVEESPSEDFSATRVVYSGAERQVILHGQRDQFYRVLASFVAASSDWSDGTMVAVDPPGRWDLNPAGLRTSDTALAVQRALLRMCAARGDLLAMLALPQHAREEEALAYIAALTLPAAPSISYRTYQAPPRSRLADAPPIGFGEAGALSYGAVYHPWLIVREERRPEALRRIPPDGAACGLIARRTIDRGAWIAPANQPLRDVAALTPPIDRDRWLDIQEAQINLVRQEPHGFLSLSASTLSSDADLRPINVRRLLILLRRLALRHGTSYVFEPNGDLFRRLAQRDFEALLDGIFVRGAFAGRTPDESYQVIVGGTPRDADQGRLVIELRVAPSQPLTFLTVMLVQTSEQGRVVEVR